MWWLPQTRTVNLLDGSRERLALLDDVRREHLGRARARVLRGVHGPGRNEEDVPCLQRRGRFALHFEDHLTLQHVADLLAWVRVLGGRRASVELPSREPGL